MSYATRVIRRLDLPGQANKLLGHDRYWRVDVATEFFEACDQMIFEHPRSGLEMAHVGAELVRRLRQAPADLEARGLYTLAAAYRAVGELAQAARQFTLARDFCDRHPVSPRCSAALAEREVNLHLALGRYQAALDTIRYVILLHQAESREPIDPWVVEGVVLVHQEDFNGALACFHRVLQQATPTEYPRAYLATLHNLTYVLGAQGVSPEDIAQARNCLRRSRKLIRGIRDTPIRYRLDWIEALIHRRLGELPQAFRLLTRARRGFLRMGLAQEYVHTTLELALLLQADGSSKQILELLQETIALASRIGAEQTTLGALILAAEQDRAEQAIRVLRQGLLPGVRRRGDGQS